MHHVDLFAGGGAGWEHASHAKGNRVSGIENWAPAIKTREALGFETPHEDVTTFEMMEGEADLVTGSPPCTKYAKAGNSPAHRHLEAVRSVVRTMTSPEATRSAYSRLSSLIGDESAALVVEPLRLILEARPMFAALEQTPTVLCVWQEYEPILQRFGYRTDSAIVCASWFGVPQTRKRAILFARRDGHDPAIPRKARTTAAMKDFIVTRDADAWMQRSNYSGSATATKRTAAERGRTMRTMYQPSVTITSKVFNWEHVETKERIPVSVREMSLLQSFAADHPWQGGVSDRRQQIGNSVPRLMGDALIEALMR